MQASRNRKQTTSDSPRKIGLERVGLVGADVTRLEVFRHYAAERFGLLVFEGADCEADLTSIGWRGPVANLLDWLQAKLASSPHVISAGSSLF